MFMRFSGIIYVIKLFYLFLPSFIFAAFASFTSAAAASFVSLAYTVSVASSFRASSALDRTGRHLHHGH